MKCEREREARTLCGNLLYRSMNMENILFGLCRLILVAVHLAGYNELKRLIEMQGLKTLELWHFRIIGRTVTELKIHDISAMTFEIFRDEIWWESIIIIKQLWIHQKSTELIPESWYILWVIFHVFYVNAWNAYHTLCCLLMILLFSHFSCLLTFNHIYAAQ